MLLKLPGLSKMGSPGLFHPVSQDAALAQAPVEGCALVSEQVVQDIALGSLISQLLLDGGKAQLVFLHGTRYG